MTSARFNAAFLVLIGHEGGFVDNPADPGGATKLGISLRYARSKGTLWDLNHDGGVDAADIRVITKDQAGAAYWQDFWQPMRADEMPADLALLAFDFAVNSGPRQATLTLQRAAGVAADGRIGPLTMAALRGEGVAERYHVARMRFMGSLPNWPNAGRGCASRMVQLAYQARDMAAMFPA